MMSKFEKIIEFVYNNASDIAAPNMIGQWLNIMTELQEK